MGRLGEQLGKMERFAKLGRLGWGRKYRACLVSFSESKALSSKSSGKRQRERKMERQGKNQRGVGLQSLWFRKGCYALLATLASLGDSGDWGLALSDSTVWQGLDYAGNGNTSAPAPGVQRERNAIGCSGISGQAEKEYSRNNIKSLHAATKSLDHAQKALREVATASWCGGYSCVW